ncbi:MAG: phosphopentomutase [Eubacteriales bacterium]|nr:phosphopentomutase [Eubacteriales bacterium]
MNYKRVFLIVIDSLGIGYDDKAYEYSDVCANTLGHILETFEKREKPLRIPNLEKMGLIALLNNKIVNQNAITLRLNEMSNGKDTMTGHWEMMGYLTTKPFITFTQNGFPKELIEALEKETNKKIIGNKAASGTTILDELAEEEILSSKEEIKKMIVYTSADSVLQICGNEETFDLKELYNCCEIARKLTMKDEWKVGRVIARPYIGKRKGEFKRTDNRRDYAVSPPIDTALNILQNNKFDTISIGKISDIFATKGISEAYHSKSSVHGMEQTIDIEKNKNFNGICFVNLVDFDALWGHRRNVIGYGEELEKFDEKLGEFVKEMKDTDLLMITADHGNDPTFRGTDHTRERVPLVIYAKDLHNNKRLEDQNSFAVIASTILKNFNLNSNDQMIKTNSIL